MTELSICFVFVFIFEMKGNSKITCGSPIYFFNKKSGYIAMYFCEFVDCVFDSILVFMYQAENKTYNYL